MGKTFRFIGTIYTDEDDTWLDMAVDFDKNYSKIQAFLDKHECALAKIKIKIIHKMKKEKELEE